MYIADKDTLDEVENIVDLLGDHIYDRCTINVEGEIKEAVRYYLEKGCSIACDINKVGIRVEDSEIEFTDAGYGVTKTGTLFVYSYTSNDMKTITYLIR